MEPVISILGIDPPTRNRLNACSYQQSVLTTFEDFQYAAFYSYPATVETPLTPQTPRYVCLSRRATKAGCSAWEAIVFEDYAQTIDDGHNTISLGISSDGTLHFAFDHHCNRLRLRTSAVGLAKDPSRWSTEFFTETMSCLPGIDDQALFEEVSYPRFVNMAKNMLLEYRIGRAGEGSNVLFRYSSDLKTWKFLGTYLTGVANNPYPNGLSYANGIVHVSWTYRHFIHYDGAKDPNSTAHQAQAGPNGPENNADLCYAYSIDTGDSWLNSEGAGIADLTKAETILPSTRGITVFEISRGSGVLNQESQTIDSEGNFHVLNRQKDANGNERWYHYWRKSDGEWRSRPILSAKLSSGGLYGLEPTEAGPRGSLISKNGYLYVVIQGNRDSSLTLLRSPSSTDFESMEVVWTGDSFQGEPLFDESMLGNCESLSVFSIQGGKVVVLDFNIG